MELLPVPELCPGAKVAVSKFNGGGAEVRVARPVDSIEVS